MVFFVQHIFAVFAEDVCRFASQVLRHDIYIVYRSKVNSGWVKLGDSSRNQHLRMSKVISLFHSSWWRPLCGQPILFYLGQTSIPNTTDSIHRRRWVHSTILRFSFTWPTIKAANSHTTPQTTNRLARAPRLVSARDDGRIRARKPGLWITPAARPPKNPDHLRLENPHCLTNTLWHKP